MNEPAYEPDKHVPRHDEFILPDRRVAPTCMVRFRCPKCRQECVENAFLGAVLCLCQKPLGTPMEAISIVRDVEAQGFHPDSEPRVRSEHAIREVSLIEQIPGTYSEGYSAGLRDGSRRR